MMTNKPGYVLPANLEKRKECGVTMVNLALSAGTPCSPYAICLPSGSCTRIALEGCFCTFFTCGVKLSLVILTLSAAENPQNCYPGELQVTENSKEATPKKSLSPFSKSITLPEVYHLYPANLLSLENYKKKISRSNRRRRSWRREEEEICFIISNTFERRDSYSNLYPL